MNNDDVNQEFPFNIILPEYIMLQNDLELVEKVTYGYFYTGCWSEGKFNIDKLAALLNIFPSEACIIIRKLEKKKWLEIVSDEKGTRIKAIFIYERKDFIGEPTKEKGSLDQTAFFKINL